MFLHSVLILLKKLKNNYLTSYYCYILFVFKERRSMKRKGLGVDFIDKSNEKKKRGVFMVLYVSYLVVERLEQFLHGGMFGDKFFSSGWFSFLKIGSVCTEGRRRRE